VYVFSCILSALSVIKYDGADDDDDDDGGGITATHL